jgi:hypothetical protein
MYGAGGDTAADYAARSNETQADMWKFALQMIMERRKQLAAQALDEKALERQLNQYEKTNQWRAGQTAERKRHNLAMEGKPAASPSWDSTEEGYRKKKAIDAEFSAKPEKPEKWDFTEAGYRKKKSIDAEFDKKTESVAPKTSASPEKKEANEHVKRQSAFVKNAYSGLNKRRELLTKALESEIKPGEKGYNAGADKGPRYSVELARVAQMERALADYEAKLTAGTPLSSGEVEQIASIRKGTWKSPAAVAPPSGFKIVK